MTDQPQIKITRRSQAIPGDHNYKDHFVEVDGVTFHAFPFQSYTTRIGEIRAEVSSTASVTYAPETTERVELWGARIYQCYKDGKSKLIESLKLPTQDYAFIWASGKLKELQEAK